MSALLPAAVLTSVAGPEGAFAADDTDNSAGAPDPAGTPTVAADGTGTLQADNPLGSRYRLQAGTMSIRKFSTSTALPKLPPVRPISS